MDIDDKQQEQENALHQTLKSTQKASLLQSKLVSPEMFYVTENFYRK